MIAAVLVTAAILVCLIQLRQPQFAQREQFEGAEKGQWTQRYECQSEQLARIASPIKKQARTQDCTRDAEQHREDYENRWQAVRTAQAAEQAAEIAFRQALISVISVVILLAAFAASFWAAIAAIHAAEAADNTLKHEQWSAERELRAYVFVHTTRVKEKNELGTEPIWIRMGYCNSGKTPAKNVRISVRAVLVPGDQLIDLSDLPEPRLIGPLGPKDERSRDVDIEITPEATRRHSEGKNEIHLFGKITYDDEFEPGRWTTFHAYLGGDAKRGKTMHTAEAGNDYV